MAVGTGGQGFWVGKIFCQPPKNMSLKITTYKSVYSYKAKIGSLVSEFWKSQISFLYESVI